MGLATAPPATKPTALRNRGGWGHWVEGDPPVNSCGRCTTLWARFQETGWSPVL